MLNSEKSDPWKVYRTLTKAAEEGDLKTIQKAIDSDVPRRIGKAIGRSEKLIFGDLLVLSAAEGRENIVRYLLEEEEYPKKVLDDALQASAVGNHLEIFDYLWSKGANDLNGALFIAKESEPEIIQHLLDLNPSRETINRAIEQIEDNASLEVFLESGKVDMDSDVIRRIAEGALEDENMGLYELLVKYGYLSTEKDLLYIIQYSIEYGSEFLESVLETILTRIEDNSKDRRYYYKTLSDVYTKVKDPKIKAALKEMKEIRETRHLV